MKRKGIRNRLDFVILEPRHLMAAVGFEPANPRTLSPTVPTAVEARSFAQNPTARIVNGVQTDQFESVGLLNRNCTGVLISPQHVLTAAHCITGLRGNGARFEVGGRTYNSVRITTHPNYNDNRFYAGYDIAIVELSQAVTNVTPAEINRTIPQVGQLLTLVGFGQGGTSTGGFDRNDTGKQVGTTELEAVTNFHLRWTFDRHTEANTAPGDSGGPAFITVNGRRVIAGITSGGSGDAHRLGDNSFDTRVDVFASWIDSVVGNVTTTPTQPPTQSPAQPPTQPGDDHVNSANVAATEILLNNNGQGFGSGVLERAGDRDAFRFTITQAGQTTITLSATDGQLDPMLRIYDSRGQWMGQNDDYGNSFNSRVTMHLAAGTYYAVADSYLGQGSGRYQMRVNHAVTTPPTSDVSRTFINALDREIGDRGTRQPFGVSWVNVQGMQGRVSDVNVSVNVAHQKISDLRLILISPNKQRIVLSNRIGGEAKAYSNTTFDQQSNRDIRRATAPFTGRFKSAISLNQLNGIEPNGQWLLVAIDFAGGNVGTIKSFALELTTTVGGRTAKVDAGDDTDRQSRFHQNQSKRPAQTTNQRNRLSLQGSTAQASSTTPEDRRFDASRRDRSARSAQRLTQLDSAFATL